MEAYEEIYCNVDQNFGSESGSGSRVSESGSATLLSDLIAQFFTINTCRTHVKLRYAWHFTVYSRKIREKYSENFKVRDTEKSELYYIFIR